MLRCAKPCQCVLSQPVANPHSTGASHQIDQRLRSVSADSTTQIGGGSERARFLRFLCVKSSSHDSLVHILPTSPSKSAPSMPVSFWSANQALATVLYTFRRQLSQIELRTRGNPTPATSAATLPGKTGFVLESVFAREFTHFRTVTLPSCLMVGGWHGDVVDMMMGLTWWCGWHNGPGPSSGNSEDP